MKLLNCIVVLALLAGCGAPRDGNDVGPSGQIAATAGPDLSGHYLIDALGPRRLEFPFEISADEDSIWWEPACAGQGLDYRATGERGVEFFDPRDPDEMHVVCDIGFPQELPGFWTQLAGQRRVELAEDRTLYVHVDGERWTFEPTTDPLPASLAGSWSVEEIDGLSTVEMRMVTFQADDSEIWWDPRCAHVEITYRLDGDRFSVVDPPYTPPPPPAPGDATLAAPKPVCLIGLPTHLRDATDALQEATHVSRDNRNNLVFTGPQSRIVLSAKPD